MPGDMLLQLQIYCQASGKSCGGGVMQMNQVRYFLALCEEQNFTRAAKRCGVSQPSLTNAIKRLEQTLGGPLFNRGRRNIELTDLGRVVKPYLKQLDQCVDQAKRKASKLLATHSVKALPIQGKGDVYACTRLNVRFWHKAAIPSCTAHVRFRG